MKKFLAFIIGLLGFTAEEKIDTVIEIGVDESPRPSINKKKVHYITKDGGLKTGKRVRGGFIPHRGSNVVLPLSRVYSVV